MIDYVVAVAGIDEHGLKWTDTADQRKVRRDRVRASRTGPDRIGLFQRHRHGRRAGAEVAGRTGPVVVVQNGIVVAVRPLYKGVRVPGRGTGLRGRRGYRYRYRRNGGHDNGRTDDELRVPMSPVVDPTRRFCECLS
jgi:hypothetical protein